MFLTEKGSFLSIGASKALRSTMRSMGCFLVVSRWTKPSPSKCSRRYYHMGRLLMLLTYLDARPCTRPVDEVMARRPGFYCKMERR